MKRFRDIHKGKRIWVCGSGPSLLDVIEKKLTGNDIILACNSAVLHFQKPHYFIWVDGGVRFTDYYKKTLHSNQKCINLNPVVPSPTMNTTEVFGQSSDWGYWKINDYAHFPGNIVQRAVSFAYAMGASQIVLAGCDCSYGYPYDPIESEKQKNQNYHEDLYLWKMMKESNPDLPIINISQNTPLKEFPIVKFSDLCP